MASQFAENILETSDKGCNRCPPCPVCNGSSWIDLPQETKRWRVYEPGRIYECTKCGLRRVWPQPTDQENLATFNDPSYYQKVVGKKHRFFRERVRLIKSVARSNQRRLLDVGCALGDMLLVAKDEGFDAEGIELSNYAVQYARQVHGLSVSNTAVENIPGESYDIVHANHVLEHVFDPLSFFIQLHRILKPEGICVVEVPNEFRNLMARLSILLRRPRERPTPTIHLWFFDPPTLLHLAENAGFREITMLTWSGRVPVHENGIKARFGAVLRNLIRGLADRTKQGENIVVICRK